MGILFEVFKGLAWYHAGKRKVGFILLGCLAGLFSFVASLAFASMTLEDGWENSESSRSELVADGTTLVELKKEEQLLTDAMARLFADGVTSSLKYAAELQHIRLEENSCSPDNADCEGFFGRLKNEMFYNRTRLGTTAEQFTIVLDQYIRWYNESRIKVPLGGHSPIAYRKSLGLST